MEENLGIERTTLSFYRYVKLEEPEVLRDAWRSAWQAQGILGRIYLAHEGINAQVSVPRALLADFQEQVRAVFPDIPFKYALEEKDLAFAKLKIKVRPKIVADGLEDETFDVTDVGTHLDAQAFNAALAQEGTLVVDMRNHYECEVGRFPQAIVPEANTFREALPEVVELLKDQKDKKILLYCTGGIRCEKASSWLRHQGFKDVNQLHGGIIDYARQVREEGLASAFIGKNFVFDQRMGERVTPDVIAQCHQCGTPCDEHHNCAYEGCNRLFLQCADCSVAFEACCSKVCQEIKRKPKAERVLIQHVWEQRLGPKHYWSRTRLPRSFALQEPTKLEPWTQEQELDRSSSS